MKQPSFERNPKQYAGRSVHSTTKPGLGVCVVYFEITAAVAPQSPRRVEALAENKALAEVC